MKRAALALLLVACGQTAQPAQQDLAQVPATTLTYTDPPAEGWRLVRDPASTTTRLLLDVVGPSGLMTRGAAVNLQLPPGIRARAFDETRFPVKDLGVYELRNVKPFKTPEPDEPLLVAGAVKPGNLLTFGVFQKDRRATAKDSGAPLFQIALELDPGFAVISGQKLVPTVAKAKYMAEDIGAFSTSATPEMVAKAVLHDFTLAVGEIHAQ